MVPVKSTQLLENKSLAFLLFARVIGAFSVQMVTIAVGWQIYSITDSAFYLGLVGLVEFIPMFLLTIFVGYVADRFNRKVIICLCKALEGVAVLFLAFVSYKGWITKEIILITVSVLGIVNSFQGPPMQAMLPNIVSKENFPRAAALLASAFQFATIMGPAFGGILYSFGPNVVYTIAGVLSLCTSFLISLIVLRNQQVNTQSATIKSLFAGISFIKSKPIILGAISLDLFAVLFGGATAVLPVFASKILMVGPIGLGVMRSAPAVGALLMSIVLARRPLKRRVGHIMFTAVIFFGIATILFSLSKSFILSLAFLFVLGASDVISVVIRSTLVQLETPDNMRGRVSSVNQMFIGTSNQLGEFESGITTAWFGPVNAVLIGGIGTIIVVLLWIKLFPKLWSVDKLENS
ncbi:MFS transporter [Clostridium sp. YIM B02551]|uniref:MFS transporter n=1 Tax=Clostridium sp. YIM B02551 TaxID=2910679 RepID=UPI001EEB41CC|nr:MFS transporter [Clostridium sp. YIM B02551]